ncbi:MAG: hypothetical protein AB1589_17260 [Cyanobacteriota bacterium]
MKNVKLPPAFQQIFFTVVCFTLLSGGASFWFAAKDNLSPQQNRVFENCNTTWNMGIGAIFGLLGSKATDLFQSDDEEQEKE